ncbi:MAG TPA: patatin-like phospholipase family protein [Deltaproteobacteria bacterium]|nr:patatin-like phospholipase family protein [Deltaproteobacteria bacterium]HPP80422.1 patatin-like phospholipase family protein [Deltaproteobacteria bacterium]
MKRSRPRIGIALDSGGAMGGAHVGVLDVLAGEGFRPEVIVGSSAGAAVGAVFAAGKLDEFASLISDMSFIKSLGLYVDPVFPYSGLLAGNRARAFLRELLGDAAIEDLPVKFAAVATDLLTGETVAIDSGPLADAVMASIAIPGIFRPVVHMGRLLTDGGVSDPLPIDILRNYAPDIVIACNLHPRMTTRYSQANRRKIVEAERSARSLDDDLASGMIERVIGLVKSQIPSTGEVLKALPRALAERLTAENRGAILNSDIVKWLRETIDEKATFLDGIKELATVRPAEKWRMSIVDIILNVMNIQQYQKNRLMLKYEPPDILIEPDVVDIAALEFNKSALAMEEGRRKAAEAVVELRRLVTRWGGQSGRSDPK